MGNTCSYTIIKKSSRNSINDAFFSLVRTAVSDWFSLGIHFDDLPDTIRVVLTGHISLTCNLIFKTTRDFIEKDHFEEVITKKETVKYPHFKRALTYMIQWSQDRLSAQMDMKMYTSSEIEISPHTWAKQNTERKNLIDMLIQIIDCEEKTIFRNDMDHIRITALRVLQQQCGGNNHDLERNKILLQIKIWNDRHFEKKGDTFGEEKSLDLEEEKKFVSTNSASTDSLFPDVKNLENRYREFIGNQDTFTSWKKPLTDPLPLTKKKWAPIPPYFSPTSLFLASKTEDRKEQPEKENKYSETSSSSISSVSAPNLRAPLVWSPEFPLVVKDVLTKITQIKQETTTKKLE